MSIRNCPNCNSKLHNFDNYFCSVCGEKLPGDIVRLPDSIKRKDYTSPASLGTQKSKSSFLPRIPKPAIAFDRKTFIMIVVFTVTVSLALGMYFLVNTYSKPLQDIAVAYLSGRDSSRLVPVQLTEQGRQVYSSKELELYLTLPINAGILGASEYPELIPGETELYIEVSDLDGVIEYYLSEGFIDERILSLADFVDNNFAVFVLEDEGERYWAAVFDIVNEQDGGTALREALAVLNADEEVEWFFEISGDYLVMSKNPAVFERVDGVRNDTELNLFQNPEYSDNIDQGNQTGKARVVFLTFAGKAEFENLKDSGIGGEFNSSIDEILDTRYKSLLIKD